MSLKLAIGRAPDAREERAGWRESGGCSTWHGPCDLELEKECAAVGRNGRVFARGGRRNRGERMSSLVTMAQAHGVLRASARAMAIGRPFNRFTTIHFAALGIPDDLATRAIGRFVKLASDWLATKGERMVWAWVRETGLSKGPHVHLLFHLPVELASGFNARQPRWIRLLPQIRAGACARVGRQQKGTVFSRRIGGSLGAFRTRPRFFALNLLNTLSYVLKGAAPAVIASLGLRRSHDPGGLIVGKRAGGWQDRRAISGAIRGQSRARARV